MCDCLNKDDSSYKWIIKPYSDLFSDTDIEDLNTELSESATTTIKIDGFKEEKQCLPIGDFFWLVDLGDGVLYKIKEFTDKGYILEDDPWTTEGTKIN